MSHKQKKGETRDKHPQTEIHRSKTEATNRLGRESSSETYRSYSNNPDKENLTVLPTPHSPGMGSWILGEAGKGPPFPIPEPL